MGEGSFGEVYRAFDTGLHREVALKLLHEGQSPARQSARVLKEARLLARLRHPNVVIVHGAEQHDNRVGLWMEFIHGSTLEKLLKVHGPFAAGEAARIGQELCHALAAVHAAGLVHRDIKAQNVIRETGGRVVLMDFGAGEWRDRAARGPSRLTGTPLYLAPEVLDGGRATARSDIYSLGVLLYHLVTNAFPVTGASLDDLRHAQREGKRTPLDDARHDLPDDFVRTIERAIDPDPSRRFSSAGAMLSALRPDYRGRSAGWTDRIQGWVRTLRTNRRAQAIAASMLVVSILGGVMLFRSLPRATAPIPVRSIAVLLDGAPARESAVVAAGFAEGLTAALAKIETLNVAQWSTTASFSGQGPEAASAALGVDAIVALQVIVKPPPAGSQAIDVRARILRRNSRAAAVETISGSLSQVAPLQASLALAIARQSNVTVSSRDLNRLQRGARPINPDAYIEYVQGIQRSLRRDESGLRTAVGHYERAIRLDPQMAAAHAARSEAYSLLRGNFGAFPAQLAADAAVGAAMNALELDDTLVDGWVSLGFARFYLHWDWPGAEQAFRKAIELNPAHATARHYYGNFLNAMGRQDEGLQQRQLARDRDPNSLVFMRGVAWNYFYMRRYAEAARELEAIAAVDRDNASVNSLLARAYYALGRHDEGIALLQRVIATQGPTSYIEKLAFGFAAAGREAEARALLRRMTEMSRTTYIKPYDVALVHAQLGERDAALSLLEEAYDRRDSTIVSLKVDPRLDPVRGDPRFERLQARMGY